MRRYVQCERGLRRQRGGSCHLQGDVLRGVHGKLHGSCTGTITGGCMGMCDGKCDGVATPAGGMANCAGMCEGKCSALSAMAMCSGQCSATCDGTCAGECKLDAMSSINCGAMVQLQRRVQRRLQSTEMRSYAEAPDVHG